MRATFAVPPTAIALGVLALLVLALPAVSLAATAREDVVYRIRPYQKYQYYAFGNDTVQWAAWNEEGSTLAGSATGDTLVGTGFTAAMIAFQADSGTFAAQLAASIDEPLRTGAFHLLTNQIEVNTYVRGPAGTPWWCLQKNLGVAEASRLGGLPGSLAPVNGTASGRFLDSLAAVSNGGVDTSRIDDTYWVSGVTSGAPIVVNGQSYTLARRVTLATPVTTAQAVCILGCMTAPADFHARGAGDVTMEMFLGANPVAVGDPPGRTGLSLALPRRPVRGEAVFELAAPAGRAARLEIFDVRGRRVATPFDGPGEGAVRLVRWPGTGAGGGVFFARLASAGESRILRFVRLP